MADDRRKMGSAPARLRIRVAVGAVLIVVAAGGYYAWRQSHTPVVPQIQTTGLETDVVAAIERARAEVERSPRSADAWGRLGMLLFAHDLYGDCLPFLEQAEQLAPSDVRWPYYRGLSLLLDKPAEGVAALRRAADLSPSDLAVKLRLAEAFMTVDQPDDAERAFNEVLAADPRNPRALLGRGQILSRRGQWQDAIAKVDLVRDEPTVRKAAHALLAEAYQRVGNEKRADAERAKSAAAPRDEAWPDPYIIEAAKLQFGLKPRLIRATRLMASGDNESAALLLREVIHDYPSSADAQLALGKALIRWDQNLSAEAASHLSRAAELDPQLSEAHFLLGSIHFLQKDYRAAEESYRQAIKVKPENGLAHYQLGRTLLQRGDNAGALDEWRSAATHRPDLAPIHLSLGELLLHERRFDDAAASLDMAVKLDPNNRVARELLKQAKTRK